MNPDFKGFTAEQLAEISEIITKILADKIQ